MTTQANDSQAILLVPAADREDGLLPVPKAQGGARNQLRTGLLKNDWARAINLKPADIDLAWFKDGSQPVGLKITVAGVRAVGIDPADAPATKAAEAAKQVKAAKAPRAKAEPKEKPVGKRQAIIDAAHQGIVPTVPDFSAPTHKSYRKKLAAIVALVEAKDIDALEAADIKTYDSSCSAIDRFRNLAVIALKAQRDKAEAQTEAA